MQILYFIHLFEAPNAIPFKFQKRFKGELLVFVIVKHSLTDGSETLFCQSTNQGEVFVNISINRPIKIVEKSLSRSGKIV